MDQPEAHGGPRMLKISPAPHRVRIFPGDTVFAFRASVPDAPKYTGKPEARGRARNMKKPLTLIESTYRMGVVR